MKREQQLSFGPIVTDEGVTYKLWAPTVEKDTEVKVQINKQSTHKLAAKQDGWYEIFVKGSKAGDSYKFIVNDDLPVPDPASRKQVSDVHGESAVISPNSFNWQDENWIGREWEEAIVYELHVGTFTKEGTFLAAIEKLDYLLDLGITAIELMPIADFPGKRNWGYDGVLLYAPDRSYGSPEDLKLLIQTAHQKRLMVFLDVVYNHFGPDGNYLYVYAKDFFSKDKQTAWGQAINLENKIVREFFIQNALYWLNEFNLDGLRFDAVHALIDDSEKHFLEELSERIRKETDKTRKIHLILENEHNQAKYLEKNKNGVSKFYTAQWNDDFHHCVRYLTTGQNTGYYKNYESNIQEKLLRALTEGFVFQGEDFEYNVKKSRGEASDHLSLQSFVNFIQNHDQVGNRAFGDRLGNVCVSTTLESVAALYILCPSIPMIFMGEEWNTTSPFMFFNDFNDELAKLVRDGRKKEFANFPEFKDPTVREKIPNPDDDKTFLNSKLNWKELENESHARIHKTYSELIKLRKQFVIPQIKECKNKPKITAKKVNDETIRVVWRFENENDGDSELSMVIRTVVNNFECRVSITKNEEVRELFPFC